MSKLDKIIEIGQDYSDYQLGEIIRYNGKNKIKQESVAEHSFMTALNTIKICKILNIDDKIRDKAVTASVIHDLSEKYIGDIAYEFKSDDNNKEILDDLFDKYEKILYNSIYKHTIGDTYLSFINKDDKLIDRIVKLSDSVSVVQYAEREINLGNKSDEMNIIYKGGLERVRYDYDKLRRLLNEKS